MPADLPGDAVLLADLLIEGEEVSGDVALGRRGGQPGAGGAGAVVLAGERAEDRHGEDEEREDGEAARDERAGGSRCGDGPHGGRVGQSLPRSKTSQRPPRRSRPTTIR